MTYALSKTVETKTQALCGLLPLVFFYAECAIVFTTQWGQTYPALAVLLVFPSYCLMTCRHIICSVTKMKFNWRQFNPEVGNLVDALVRKQQKQEETKPVITVK